jgi:hypothetical protein
MSEENKKIKELKKCAYCDKSLAGLMINVEHIVGRKKYCSKECFERGENNV